VSCNRDSNCLNIANTYSSSKGSINTNLNSVKTSISEIDTKLKSFNVPNDYIGNKVLEKINSISSDLSTSSSNVDSFKQSVNTFINQKEQEHRNHYQAWKKKQEELKAGDKETNE
jgi:hypothetical protein